MVLLLALALNFFLGRYEMVYNEHGTFLVGIDYVDQNIGLPLQWLVIVACLGRRRCSSGWAAGSWRRLDGAGARSWTSPRPRLVSALYVRPNEISLQRPYIQTHIHATRSAFGLEQRVQGDRIQGAARRPASTPAAHKPLLDNVRLWDWRAFHDTVTQIQALRPYYVFADTDVDRYTIDGQYRQVLLSPRELDIQPTARRARQLDQSRPSSTRTATAWCWRR